MASLVFTNNLKRHIECPDENVVADTVRELLDSAFKKNTKLKNYVLDDQGRLRQHMLVLIDGVVINDRVTLTDTVLPHSKVYVMQALSGG